MSIATIFTAAKTRSLALAARALPMVTEEGPKVAFIAAGVAAMILLRGNPEMMDVATTTLTLGIRG